MLGCGESAATDYPGCAIVIMPRDFQCVLWVAELTHVRMALGAGVWRSIDSGSRCIVEIHEIATADTVMPALLSSIVALCEDDRKCPLQLSVHTANLGLPVSLWQIAVSGRQRDYWKS